MRLASLLSCAGVAAALLASPSLRADPAVALPPDPAALVSGLAGSPEAPDRAVLERAVEAYARLAREGRVRNERLTIIDYSRPSTEPRLWVVDVPGGRVLFRELVAHGKNSGEDRATSFGNEAGSLKSSLGTFVTGETYTGKHGYSLRLDGLDAGVNDRARERAIVFHGADYVSEAFAERQGRLGRSWGCPALRPDVAAQVIDAIKGGSVVFAAGP